MAVGGARKGAGRPKGSRSAATKEQQATISEMAKKLAPDALAALHYVATQGESESARVAAASNILDRAYGKPVQATEQSPDSEAVSLNITIGTAKPVGEIRVTRSNP